MRSVSHSQSVFVHNIITLAAAPVALFAYIVSFLRSVTRVCKTLRKFYARSNYVTYLDCTWVTQMRWRADDQNCQIVNCLLATEAFWWVARRPASLAPLRMIFTENFHLNLTTLNRNLKIFTEINSPCSQHEYQSVFYQRKSTRILHALRMRQPPEAKSSLCCH